MWRGCLSYGIYHQNLFQQERMILSWFHSIIVSRIGSWVSKLLLLLCFLYCKNDCIDSKNVWFLGGRYYLHFSQSPLGKMSKIVRIERLPARPVHICTEATGVEILTQPGKGSEKNFFPVIFPASFQTVPLPLSWFETHPRWPPVTQYAIVGLACEQSSYYHDYTLLEIHREREFLGKTIQTGSSLSVRNSCDRRNM